MAQFFTKNSKTLQAPQLGSLPKLQPENHPSKNLVAWASLPKELLQMILLRLSCYNIADYMSFSGVCTLWRSVALVAPVPCALQIPMLLLKVDDQFFSCNLLAKKYKYHPLEIPKDLRCHGASHGWLILTDEKSRSVVLLDPVTRAQISLPDIPERVNENQILPSLDSLGRIVLSSHPTMNDTDCIAMGCISNDLVVCRLGDRAWKTVEVKRKTTGEVLEYHNEIEDLSFCEGRFWFLDLNDSSTDTTVVVGDLVGNSLLVEEIMAPELSKNGSFYLSETCGELLLVITDYMSKACSVITSCKVFKLDLNTHEWLRIESLGELTLFLSMESSLSVRSSIHPGLQSNCVYFLDHCYHGDPSFDEHHCHCVIYNLEEDSIKFFNGYQGKPVFWHKSSVVEMSRRI